MQTIKDFITRKYDKKAKNYRPWQELAAQIVKYGRIDEKDVRLVFIFASKAPTQELYQLLSQIKQKEIKPPVIKYIKWLMKK